MKRMTVMLAVLLALFATGVSAQSLTGTITGKVVDEQGAVLPGVTVTLTGRQGAVPTVTDDRGEFRFVGLNPGQYEVKAELTGFATRTEPGVDVSIGRTAMVNFTMKVGGMTETVEVVGNAATIDITSTATDNALSSDLLQNMPINIGNFNAATSLLNYTPGVNGGSGFGGDASYGNALLIDGVDTRDPEGGSAWVFFNFNIVEEVQVGGLGAPAEYGGFSGAVVNTITKSGGNKYSGLFELRHTNDSLAGKNISAENLKLNPALGSANVMKKLNDYTVQLGGPIKKDKAFWWFSVQRYAIEQDPTGPRAKSTEVSPRYNGKITLQPTPNDTIIGSFQFDNYNVTGRLGAVPAAEAIDSQTLNQDSPEAIWNAQYRKVFGSSTFLEAKFTGYWGYYYLDPVMKNWAYHNDQATGEETGGAGYYYQADRGRNQVNISLSQFADFYGSHNFKFGAEIERSKSWSRYAYQYFLDYEGEPYYLITGSYDIEGRNKRESFYAQDQWRQGRLTANLGVRLDRIRGFSPKADKNVYTPKLAVGPRLGLAFDVTGKGSTVAKAFWGRYYEGASFNPWQRATPGYNDTIYYEVFNGQNSEVDRVPPIVYSICSGDSMPSICNGNEIKHLGLDEFNVALEHQLRRDLRLSLTYIRRDYKNFINSVAPLSRWSTTSATLPTWPSDQGADPLSSLPRTLAMYKWDNRTASNEDFVIRNTEGWQYLGSNGQVIGTIDPWRKYNGVMAVLTKSYSNRWQAQLSYVWSKAEGSVSNGGTTSVAGVAYENPTRSLINTVGLMPTDRTHEIKAFAGYQIPFVEVNLSAYFRYLTGVPYQPVINVSRTTLGTSSAVDVPLVARSNDYRLDNNQQFDLRAEKTFSFDVHRFGVFVDVQNLFNTDVITGIQTRYPNRSISYVDLATNESLSSPVKYGAPTSVQAPRQITIGARWSF